jgi:hypothetical protein
MTMQTQYSQFPGGAPGVGLLLLRMSVAAGFSRVGIPLCNSGTKSLILGSALIVAAVLVAAGLRTSISAGAGALCLMASGGQFSTWFFLFSLAMFACSLMLLGPGAYSLEARLSGWRVINLPSHDPTKWTQD